METIKILSKSEFETLKCAAIPQREPRLKCGDILTIIGAKPDKQQIVVRIKRNDFEFEADFYWRFLTRKVFNKYVLPSGVVHYDLELANAGPIVEKLSHAKNMAEYLFNLPPLKVVSDEIKERWLWTGTEYIASTFHSFGFVEA